MKALRKPVYFLCGDYTVSLGTGRKEFHPKKPRPGIEHYIEESGKAAVSQRPSADMVDSAAVGNFMAARFNRQGHLNALFPAVLPNGMYTTGRRISWAGGHIENCHPKH